MDPKACSGADVARVFGVDKAMVTRWKKAGMPHRNGVFSLPDCIRWRMERETEALNAKAATPEGERWLTAFRRERARLARLERLARQGELVSKQEVIDGWVSRISCLRAGLLGLASRLPPLCEGKSLVELRAPIYDAVWNLLDDYSRPGKWCPTPDEERKKTDDAFEKNS